MDPLKAQNNANQPSGTDANLKPSTDTQPHPATTPDAALLSAASLQDESAPPAATPGRLIGATPAPTDSHAVTPGAFEPGAPALPATPPAAPLTPAAPATQPVTPVPISPLPSAPAGDVSISTDDAALKPADAPVAATSINPAAPVADRIAATAAATPPSDPVSQVPAGSDIPPATPAPGATSSGHGSGGTKKLLIILVIVLVLAVAGAAAMLFLKKDDGADKATAAPAKVGFLMALTGGSSSMGFGTNKGIQLAKKQLKADNITIVQADSKCDPKVAAEAIKRLIAQKVVAIIGDGCSSASTAALPAANNAKIPMISPTASSPSLSTPNDYFFRVIPNDNFQGAFMAQAIFDKGLRKVAVFYTNESYGSSMSKVFKEKFESLGGQVVNSVSAESDVIDLKAQMNTLKVSKPDALFISPNSVVSATAAIKVAREVGITAPFFGADIFYDNTIIKDVPTATEGMTITSFSTGTKSFNQALLNEYQVTDQLYGAAEAYDAFHAIYLATKKGATTGEQVAQMLPDIAFDGVSARIAFDQNGEISDKAYKYALLQVKGGEFISLGQ